MIRKYSLVIEGDDVSGYSAYVPELPAILITGPTVEELSSRAREVIRIYWDHLRFPQSTNSLIRETEVELQA